MRIVRLNQSYVEFCDFVLLPPRELLLTVAPVNGLLVIPGIFIALVLFLAIVARLERRMVWPYGKPEANPQFGDPMGYGARRIYEATQLGFRFYGWAPDVKGSNYRVNYGILVSPQNDSFVVIGVGTIMGMTLQGTWIHTPAVDDRSFYSSDNQNCIEMDVSRLWKNQLVPGAGFTTLWQKHQDWFAQQRVVPRGFQPGREFEDFYALRLAHFELLERRKYIAFTDSSKTYWRYTFYGAVKLALLNYTIGLVRAVTGGNLPRTA